MLKLTALFRLTFIVLLAGAGLSACADFDDGLADYDEGVAALERGEFATALRKLQPLAEQGHARAQAHLGLMYHVGAGVPQIHKMAAQWYRRAAEQGNAEAQASLGLMYVQGKGVPRDFVYAYMWASIATPGNDKDAVELRNLVEKLVEKQMSSFQIAEAQKLARECVRKEYKNC